MPILHFVIVNWKHSREDDLIVSEELEKKEQEQEQQAEEKRKEERRRRKQNEEEVANKQEMEGMMMTMTKKRSTSAGDDVSITEQQHRRVGLGMGIGNRGEYDGEQIKTISKLPKDNYENEFQWGNDGMMIEDLWHRFQRVQLHRKKLADDEQQEILNVEEWDKLAIEKKEEDGNVDRRHPDEEQLSQQNRAVPKSYMDHHHHHVDKKWNEKKTSELIHQIKKEKSLDDVIDNRDERSIKEKLRNETKESVLSLKHRGSVDRLGSNRDKMMRKQSDVGISSDDRSEGTTMTGHNRIEKNSSGSSSLMKLTVPYRDSRGMTIETINVQDEMEEDGDDDFELIPHQILTIHRPIYDGQIEEEIHRQLDLIPLLSVPEPSSLPLLSDTAAMMRDGFSEDISVPSACFSSNNTSLQYSEEETYDDLQFPENGELRLKLPDPLILSEDDNHHHRFEESREKRGIEEILEEDEMELMNDLEIHEENFEDRLLDKLREMQQKRQQQQQRGRPIPDGHHPSRIVGMNHERQTTTVDDNNMGAAEYNNRVPRLPLFLEQLKQRNSEIVEEQEIEEFGVDIPMNLDFMGQTRDGSGIGGMLREFGDGTELDHLEDMTDERDTVIPKTPQKFSRSSSRKSSVQATISPMTVPSSPSKIPLHRNSNLRSKSIATQFI